MPASCAEHRVRFFTGDRMVSIEDVVTVREALSSCDPGLLVRAVLEEELAWSCSVDRINDKGLRVLKRKAKQALVLFSGMPSTADPYPNYMIVPLERFERDGDGRIQRRILAVGVDLSLADDAERALVESGGLTSSAGAAREVFERRRDASRSLAPGWRWWSSRSLGLASLAVDPWPETLSRRIWLPSSFSAWERACVMGNVFWLMTYRGAPDDCASGVSPSALATRVRASDKGFKPYDEIRFVSGEPSDAGSAISSVRDGAAELSCGGSSSRCMQVDESTADSSIASRMFEWDGFVAFLNYNCRIDMLQIASSLGRLDACKTAPPRVGREAAGES